MKKLFKKIDYRWYIYSALFVVSILLAVFVYNASYIRLWEALRNVVTSAAVYSNEFFGTSFEVTPGAAEFTSVDVEEFLPFTLDEISAKLQALFPALFSWENFASYLLFILNGLTLIMAFLPIVILSAYLIGELVRTKYLQKTEKQGNSKQLEFYLKY